MEILRVQEPRSNVKADLEKNHVVLSGGSRVTENVFPADSFSLQQLQWTIYPPSINTIVDRLFKVRVLLKVTAEGGNFLPERDSPSQFPLTSITDVLTVQINGESISDNIGDKLHAMLCYGNTPEMRNRSWSTTAAQPDQFQRYSDWSTYGNARNPMTGYGTNPVETSRGGFPYLELSPSERVYEFTEVVVLSPFYNGLNSQEEGFVNVNQININYRLKSNLGKLWSHDPNGDPLTGISVEFYHNRKPELLVTYITPDINQPRPALQTLPYYKGLDYLKAPVSFEIGEEQTLSSDTIKLGQIPRRMYVFARRSRATSGFDKPDSFLALKNMNILYNNESGLLSNATQQDLFEISRRNGINLSYAQWSKHRGAVFCVEFGSQIGLPPNLAPGVRTDSNIQITARFENTSGEAFDAELYVVMMMEGTFQIAPNVGRATLGNLTMENALNAQVSDELDYAHYESLAGGGFFSSLKSFVNKVARGVQTASKVAQAVADPLGRAIPALAPALSMAGRVGDIAGSVRGATGGTIAGGSRMGMGRRRRRLM
jgi:hypothetical protein